MRGTSYQFSMEKSRDTNNRSFDILFPNHSSRHVQSPLSRVRPFDVTQGREAVERQMGVFQQPPDII
jgi:hypothetical protein